MLLFVVPGTDMDGVRHEKKHKILLDPCTVRAGCSNARFDVQIICSQAYKGKDGLSLVVGDMLRGRHVGDYVKGLYVCTHHVACHDVKEPLHIRYLQRSSNLCQGDVHRWIQTGIVTASVEP